MKNFEFKSDICTSVEQSRRLLKLGLKKETADCYYQFLNNKWELRFGQPINYDNLLGSYLFPAWSLHRLIEILGPHRLPIHFRKKGRVDITVSYINPVHSGRSCYNYYDSIIDCIAWLIDQGYSYINQDYLEEKK